MAKKCRLVKRVVSSPQLDLPDAMFIDSRVLGYHVGPKGNRYNLSELRTWRICNWQSLSNRPCGLFFASCVFPCWPLWPGARLLVLP